MIVKDFLLSLTPETLCQRYYEEYYRNNEVLQTEAKLDGVDLKKQVFQSTTLFLNQIKEIVPQQDPNNCVMVMEYKDFDVLDNLDFATIKTFDAFFVEKDKCVDRGKLAPIQDLSESFNFALWDSYSLIMTDWAKILGCELVYFPKNVYSAAAAIINEMTFFGSTEEDHEETVKDVEKELDEASKEIEEGHYTVYDSQTFREEFDLPERTPEQEAKNKELENAILLWNLNESIRVYNALRNRGFFH